MKIGAELFHTDWGTLKRTERQTGMTKEKPLFTFFQTPLNLLCIVEEMCQGRSLCGSAWFRISQ